MNPRPGKPKKEKCLPSFGTLIALATVLPSCNSYEPPCTMGQESLLIDVLEIPDTFRTLPRLEANPNRTMHASWLTFRLDEKTAGLSVVPHGIDVVVMNQEGWVQSHLSLPLFEGDNPWDPSYDNFDYCLTSHGIFLRWTRGRFCESGGRTLRIRRKLLIQRLFLDGRVDAPISLPGMECLDCLVRVDSACRGDMASLTFNFWPIDEQVLTPTRALSWNLLTDDIVVSPLDWKEPALPKDVSALRSDADCFWLIQGQTAWVVDEQISLWSGPIPLPSSNTLMRWSEDRLQSLVVWSKAASDNRFEDSFFMNGFDGHGRPLHSKKRLGTTSHVLALAEDDHDFGVISHDDGVYAFAWVDASGVRIGGDMPLTTPGLDSHSFPATAHLLRALGQGRFISLKGTEGQLWRREIRCEPPTP